MAYFVYNLHDVNVNWKRSARVIMYVREMLYQSQRLKTLVCDDFRGIAISPLISKVFEHCILDRFSTYFTSCDAQYGFKKGVGCRNAIQTVRTIVDKMIEDGNTVNMCAIDSSKVFDKVNHKGLFTKLMKRHIPTELLELLENWLSMSSTCVKWGDSWSCMFMVSSDSSGSVSEAQKST